MSTFIRMRKGSRVVYEPPSPALLQVLLQPGLCTTRDLRRSRGAVRKLTYDLPAFDSVWIDALVQRRRLTPYQARVLSSPHPEQIHVGPSLLIEQLGSGPRAETFLARLRAADARAPFSIKRLRDVAEPEQLKRAESLVAKAAAVRSPAIVCPHACDQVQGRLVLVSRHVAGPHLGELLIRRGRFPATVVREIARQLLHGLDQLAGSGLVHGDIRLANVRLSENGQAALVDAGITVLIEPEITVHSWLPADRFDTLASELIGTGKTASSVSDLYALGCLLWQLLAGRPPFPGADPLTKMAAHQTRNIDDVRRWSPDTPADLATAIFRMTRRDPTDRPAGFAEVLAVLGQPRSAGKGLLAQWLQQFNSGVATESEGMGTLRPVLVGMLLVAIVCGVLGATTRYGKELLAHARARLQRTPSPTAVASAATNPTPVAAATPSVPVIPVLPRPDEHGVIELTDAGPYQATNIVTVGDLVIRGRDGVSPTILISGKTWMLTAIHTRLQNVHLRVESEGSQPRAGLLVKSHGLQVANCSFDAVPQGPQAATWSGAAIAWKQLDGAAGSNHLAAIRDTVFFSAGTALYLDRAAPIRLENCLKCGSGALVALRSVPDAGTHVAWDLTSVTMRESGPLVRWIEPPSNATSVRKPGKITIDTRHCVFDLREDAPLLELESSRPAELAEALSISGEATLVKMQTELRAISPTTREPVPCDTQVDIEGLSSGEFQFAGRLTRRPADSRILQQETSRVTPVAHADHEAEATTDTPPGIESTRLTVP